MTSKEADEIKAELKRIEKENQDRRDNMTSWAIIAIIVAVIIFALWNNHRINGNDSTDTFNQVNCSDHPYDAAC